MKRLSLLVLLLPAPPVFAAAPDYDITILKPDVEELISRAESGASSNLVGKSIAAVFGPLSEIRVGISGGNRTAFDDDPRKVQQNIRMRIDQAKCLGRDSEVSWSRAPWASGHILLVNGRILPVQIMLSGIVVGDLIFGDGAEPGAAPSPPIPTRNNNERAVESVPTASAFRLDETRQVILLDTRIAPPQRRRFDIGLGSITLETMRVVDHKLTFRYTPEVEGGYTVYECTVPVSPVLIEIRIAPDGTPGATSFALSECRVIRQGGVLLK